MKLTAKVFGKKGCTYCENRKSSLRKIPALSKKELGKKVEIEILEYDIKTVEGLVEYCNEDRANSDIPIVVLETESGETLAVYDGPKAPIKTRELLELLARLPS